MEIIINNPFRILGLFANAKIALANRNFNKLKMYVEADQEIPDELSLAAFPCLGPFKRAKDNIEYASSHLNLGQDKMLAALFWFYEGNPITDEPAFDELRESNIQGASDIWKKLVEKGEVNERNFSAFQNISTLYLLRAFGKTVVDNSLLYAGIGLKIQFLESDFALKYKADITDTTYKISKDDLQLLFLHEIEREIQKNKKYKESDFIDILGNIDFTAKPEFLKGFVQKPIEQIEKKIEEAKAKRKANSANGVKAANSLLVETKELIKQVNSILGTSHIKYSSIADKLAMEFFACGRDYFMYFKESETDPGDVSMKLFKIAKSYAVGNIAKQQIDENIKELQEWIEEKPERDKLAKIKTDLDCLIELFQEFDNSNETIENANSLVNRCKPNLANIKIVLGNSDDLYLKLSTRVAMQAQSYIVDEVNIAQENFEHKIKIDRSGTINKLKSTLSNAWNATLLVSKLDMESKFRIESFERNKASLQGLCNQMGIFESTQSINSSVNKKVKTKTFNLKIFNEMDRETIRIYLSIIISIIVLCTMIGIMGVFIGVFVGLILSYFIEGIIENPKLLLILITSVLIGSIGSWPEGPIIGLLIGVFIMTRFF